MGIAPEYQFQWQAGQAPPPRFLQPTKPFGNPTGLPMSTGYHGQVPGNNCMPSQQQQQQHQQQRSLLLPNLTQPSTFALQASPQALGNSLHQSTYPSSVQTHSAYGTVGNPLPSTTGTSYSSQYGQSHQGLLGTQGPGYPVSQLTASSLPMRSDHQRMQNIYGPAVSEQRPYSDNQYGGVNAAAQTNRPVASGVEHYSVPFTPTSQPAPMWAAHSQLPQPRPLVPGSEWTTHPGGRAAMSDPQFVSGPWASGTMQPTSYGRLSEYGNK